MINAILGTKGKMTQAWTEDGKRVPVTIVQAGPSVVAQVKTQERDGYQAIQLGFGQKKIKHVSKPQLGHLKRVIADKTVAPRFLREVRNYMEHDTEPRTLKVGDLITAPQVLAPGDLVKVTGVSKGKGFAGVVKRWHFAGGPKTHGQSDRHRAPGSIGQGTTPGRVYKGKKMAGRMGGKTATALNLTVLAVAGDEVKLSGLIPGNSGSLVIIEKVGKAGNFSPLVGRGGEIQPEELPLIEIVDSEDTNAEEKTDNEKLATTDDTDTKTDSTGKSV